MAFTTKIFTIVLIVTLTVTYSVYEKSKIDSLESAGQLVLKDLPDIDLSNIYGGKNIKKEDLLGTDSKGLMVHFWGTWCAPCEAELPGFIKLAERLEVLGIKFLLIAVNDDLKKI
ncbi:MAG: TlpA family protein disulfide reductase, partial [Bacteriovoracaceae bacterium]|nr:TlpA family protein disulfide reductase [Bacteriovoracaceae bacterium]